MGYQYHDQQNQQHGHRYQRRDQQRFDLHGVRRHTNGGRAGLILYPMSPHQQAMAVDAIGRAGDKCAVLLALLNGKVVQFVGQHSADLIHLVGQCLVQHPQQEYVALGQLIQIGEQLGAGQTAVAGQDTVRTLAAGRKRGALHMADGDLQNRLVRAMIDGKVTLYFGNLDVAHDAVVRNIQQGFIDLLLLLGHDKAACAVVQCFIVSACIRPNLVIRGIVQIGHLLGIAGDGAGLVERVPVIADGRIQQQQRSGKKRGGEDLSLDDIGGAGDGEDPKFWEAVEVAVDANKVSTSLLQRRLELGYGRAAKIIDRMQEMGFVSPADGNKPRKVLLAPQDLAEIKMNKRK